MNSQAYHNFVSILKTILDTHCNYATFQMISYTFQSIIFLLLCFLYFEHLFNQKNFCLEKFMKSQNIYKKKKYHTISFLLNVNHSSQKHSKKFVKPL
jgi:hypothetical protein